MGVCEGEGEGRGLKCEDVMWECGVQYVMCDRVMCGGVMCRGDYFLFQNIAISISGFT